MFFSASVKAKRLPLFELSIQSATPGIVIRYLGEKSFQRITLQVNISDTSTQLMLRLSDDALTVMVGCHQQDVQMRQRVKALPSDAMLFLGCDETHKVSL